MSPIVWTTGARAVRESTQRRGSISCCSHLSLCVDLSICEESQNLRFRSGSGSGPVPTQHMCVSWCAWVRPGSRKPDSSRRLQNFGPMKL